MNIIFFGSTTYSVEILKELLDKGYKPSLVVTQPDRPKGRGLKTASTEVKKFAIEKDLKVITPATLKDPDFISLLKDESPDLYIVVSYGKILSQAFIDIPKILVLGIHPSLLPKYRGAAPINWVLINGESETGVCLFKINAKMDEGEIIAQEKVAIDLKDDFLTLSQKIYSVSRRLLIKTLPLLEKGSFGLKAQSLKPVSLAPKIDKKTSKIDWSRDAESIRNLVRAVMPFPCAWSYFRQKRVKFWKVSSEIEDKKADFGEIVDVSRKAIKIKTKKGLILPLELQPEGKKPMSIDAFISGHHPQLGEKFY
ncbi:MAG: methionyl-tRNA formyltransferase [Candidatus Omnitrophica bacterium]|nr:methionyl-tRNA formyltransferase [Candidatus Omnitrophota bacterium]